jgi:hypothetical protein
MNCGRGAGHDPDQKGSRKGWTGFRGYAADAFPLCLSSYRNLYDEAMKTTLDINDQLLAAAKGLAARQRTSLTSLIEEGLQLRLRASAVSRNKRRSSAPAIPVFNGKGGLKTGIDPLSNKSFLAAMESDGGLK